MKKWLTLLAAAGCALSFTVYGADAPAKKAPTAQQQKMTTCNAEAKTKAPREDLCVFAFRLTEAERDAIHKAAGPAKASKFARNLLVAAATKDEAAVRAIMKEIQAET